MTTRFKACGDRVGHLDLAGSIRAADRFDRSREHIAVPDRQAGSLGRSGHRRTLVTSAAANQHRSIQFQRVTRDQLVRRQFSSKRRAHPGSHQSAVGNVLSGQELARLVNPIDKITALVRH